jgi:hypothetical protein
MCLRDILFLLNIHNIFSICFPLKTSAHDLLLINECRICQPLELRWRTLIPIFPIDFIIAIWITLVS